MKYLILSILFLFSGLLSGQNTSYQIPVASFVNYSQPILADNPTGKSIPKGLFKDDLWAGLPIFKGTKGGFYFWVMKEGQKAKRYLNKEQKEKLDLK